MWNQLNTCLWMSTKFLIYWENINGYSSKRTIVILRYWFNTSVNKKRRIANFWFHQSSSIFCSKNILVNLNIIAWNLVTRVDLDHNYWKITLIGFVLNWLPEYFWIHWLFHNDFSHTTRNPEKRDLEVTCCLINQCGSEISFSPHRQIEDCRDNDIWYVCCLCCI